MCTIPSYKIDAQFWDLLVWIVRNPHSSSQKKKEQTCKRIHVNAWVFRHTPNLTNQTHRLSQTCINPVFSLQQPGRFHILAKISSYPDFTSSSPLISAKPPHSKPLLGHLGLRSTFSLHWIWSDMVVWV